jgi:hypothetical protein
VLRGVASEVDLSFAANPGRDRQDRQAQATTTPRSASPSHQSTTTPLTTITLAFPTANRNPSPFRALTENEERAQREERAQKHREKREKKSIEMSLWEKNKQYIVGGPASLF